MTPKRIFIVLCAVLALPVSLLAQSNMTGDVTVRSVPEGAQATLSGELMVSGVTPARFRHLLIGEYQLTVQKHGYETYKTIVVLDPTKQIEIDVKLSPKTPFKATARSLFIPGWGQRYAGQKTKGYLFTGLAATAVLAYMIADNDFDDKYDYYKRLDREYDSLSSAGTIGSLQSLYPTLVDAQEEAYDAENVRRLTIGTVIGIWALNVIDAMFFFPEEKGTFSVKGLTIQPSVDPDKTGLTLAWKF